MTTTRSFITETNWGLKKEQKDFTSTATPRERQTEEISEFLPFISESIDAWHVVCIYKYNVHSAVLMSLGKRVDKANKFFSLYGTLTNNEVNLNLSDVHSLFHSKFTPYSLLNMACAK